MPQILAVILPILLSLLAAESAIAQDRVPQPTGRRPPEVARGFQMALHVGGSMPAGLATGARGDRLSARYSSQLAGSVELGLKPLDNLYLGGYFGLSLGFEGGDTRVERLCDDRDSNAENDISCSTGTVRLGLQAQYHLAPGAFWNPWLGYGVGWELAWQNIRDRPRSRSESVTAHGLQFARLSAGLDYRAHRVIGVGPMMEVALGRYTSTRTSVNGFETYDGPTPDRAVHAWIMVGIRTVIFP